MTTIAIASVLAFAFLAFLLWRLRPQNHASRNPRVSIDREMDNVLPKHYRFFAQIRQALSDGDAQYLSSSAPPRIAQQALRERRVVARRFLSGLSEDFSKLHRLARMVAALSPVISREQETERLMLGLRFYLLYAVVWARLRTGRVPLRQIEHLTGLVSRLALRMEQAITEINSLAAERLPRGVSA